MRMSDWDRELKERGWERMLVDRLSFHGRLTEAMVMECTDRSRGNGP